MSPVIRRAAVRPAPQADARPHTEERGTAHISASIRKGRQTVQEESASRDVSARRFSPEDRVAYVRVGAGTTHNLGDFSSLRIDVSVTLPCLVEEVEETYDRASELVAGFHSSEATRWQAPEA